MVGDSKEPSKGAQKLAWLSKCRAGRSVKPAMSPLRTAWTAMDQRESKSWKGSRVIACGGHCSSYTCYFPPAWWMMRFSGVPTLQVCCPFSQSGAALSACVAGLCFSCLCSFYRVLGILSWSRYPLLWTALLLEEWFSVNSWGSLLVINYKPVVFHVAQWFICPV